MVFVRLNQGEKSKERINPSKAIERLEVACETESQQIETEHRIGVCVRKNVEKIIKDIVREKIMSFQSLETVTGRKSKNISQNASQFLKP
jgi:hypothetical protein